MEDKQLTRKASTLLGRPTLQRTRTDLFFRDEIAASHTDAAAPERQSSTATQAEQENKEPEPQKLPTPPPPNSDDEFDTDLEVEGKTFMYQFANFDLLVYIYELFVYLWVAEYFTIDRSETPWDRWGLSIYLHTCRKLRQRPVGAIQRGLKSENVTVRGRGLNHIDTLALSNALLVG